jgi:hypothetical protein
VSRALRCRFIRASLIACASQQQASRETRMNNLLRNYI